MIEHMRNHKKLFKKIASWLKPDGLFFMHIFVHKSQPYLFEVQENDDWMSQYFFSGGMMPSEDLPLFFQENIKIIDQWSWSGVHYEMTANAWLKNIDTNKNKVMKVLEVTFMVKMIQKNGSNAGVFSLCLVLNYGVIKMAQNGK